MYGDQSWEFVCGYWDERVKFIFHYDCMQTVQVFQFCETFSILLSPVADEKCIPRVWRSDPFEKKNH